MTTCVALLRGINVGGNNKVAMADLRALLADLGYGNPQTYIQSGQALFETDEDEVVCAGRIAGAITAALGLNVPVLVRTAAQLGSVLAANPYPGEDGAKVLVMFFADPPPAEMVDAMDRERYAPDVFEVHGREIFCFFPDGQGRSKLAAAKLFAIGTGRNINTIRKLTELVAVR